MLQNLRKEFILMANIKNHLEYIVENTLNNPEEFIEKAEKRYIGIVNSVCDKIVSKKVNEIVMLAGPSAAGKTTTAHKIREQLQKLGHNSFTVSLDDFYGDAQNAPLDENGNPDFETVYALDLKELSKCLNELIEDKKSDLPLFDFMTGKRKEEKNTIVLEEGDVIIVEGLHALNPIITDTLPKEHLFKIYINVSSRIYDKNRHIVLNKRNIRFVRRLVRDYHFRNSSVSNTYKLWDSVTAGEDKYLFPYRNLADARINSIHLYETCVLKKKALDMLSDLPEDNSHFRDAKKLIKHLNKFPDLPIDMVPKNSLLREFLG